MTAKIKVKVKIKDWNKASLMAFTKLKHDLLLSKTEKAEGYFVQADYDAINKLSEDACEIIWTQLCKNIKNGYYGLSRKTCTFCIHDDLISKKCDSCSWKNSHGDCGNKNGDFKKLNRILDAIGLGAIEVISSKEYKSIIKKIEGE